MPPTASKKPGVVQESGLPIRQLQDPEHLRALAHPRRLEIIDLLIAEGPLTATQCGDRLDDSAASCSYHLRQLARYGFVEEVEGAKGRNRPWRWVPLGNRIQLPRSPSEEAAATALSAVVAERNLERIRRYHRTERNDPWRSTAASSDFAVWITEEELSQLVAAFTDLVAPLARRTFDGDQPDGSRLVDVLTYLMPRPDQPATSAASARGAANEEDHHA